MNATDSSGTTRVRLTLSADGERQAPEGVGEAGVALFVVALGSAGPLSRLNRLVTDAWPSRV